MAKTIEYIIKLRDQFSAQLKTVSGNAEKTLDGIKGRFDAAAAVMKGDFSQLPNVFEGLSGSALMAVSGIAAVGGAAVAAAHEIKRINDETINYADSIRKVSQAANVSGGWLSSFTEAADDLAVSQDSINTSLLMFSRNIGSGAAASALEKYGIAITDATGRLKTAQELMPQVADVFQRLGPSAEASAFAVQLFGRSGQELIPVLTQGSAALRDMQQAAIDSGIAMTDEALKSAEALRRMRDALADLRTAQERRIAPVTMTGEAVLAQMQIDALDVLGGKLENIGTPMQLAQNAARKVADSLKQLDAEAQKTGVSIDQTGASADYMGLALINAGQAAHGAAGASARMALETAAAGVAIRNAGSAAAFASSNTIAFTYTMQRAGATAMATARQVNSFTTALAMNEAAQKANAEQGMAEWNAKADKQLEQLNKVAGGYGGVSAAADMAASRISAVTGAFSAGASQLDDNAKLNTALSVATGQLSIADFAQTKAAQALSEAYKSGAINMQEAIGVTAALAKGTISTADAFQIAGDIGAKYSAEVQAVSDAVAGGATALKGITSKTGVALSDAALGAFAADLNKTVTATVQVIGIDRVNAAKEAIKGLKDTVTNITVTATVKTVNPPPDID